MIRNRILFCDLFVIFTILFLPMHLSAEIQEENFPDLKSLTSPNPYIRLEAAKKFRQCVSEIVKELIKIVTSSEREPMSEYDPRPQAIELLGEFRAPESIDVLINLLETEFSYLITETPNPNLPPAALALVMIGKPASRTIVNVLRQSNSKRRETILVEILENIEGREVAIFILESRIKSETQQSVVSNLQRALELLGAE